MPQLHQLANTFTQIKIIYSLFLCWEKGCSVFTSLAQTVWSHRQMFIHSIRSAADRFVLFSHFIFSLRTWSVCLDSIWRENRVTENWKNKTNCKLLWPLEFPLSQIHSREMKTRTQCEKNTHNHFRIHRLNVKLFLNHQHSHVNQSRKSI